MKLAELDLERRGAGDLFGTQQHGFDELQFASWTNAELIHTAKKLTEEITEKNIPWKPVFAHQHKPEGEEEIPLAN
jgi:RecG-like helicase